MIAARTRSALLLLALAVVPALPGGIPGFSAVLHAQDQPKVWTFDDEEEETPRWTDDLRAQAFDIGMVVAFSTLAFVSFFRKSVALKYVTLVAAVGYLGFYKSQLISIVNVLGLLVGNLPIFRYNLAF